MDKYQRLRDLETIGCNYDIETTDIIQKLQDWDAKYGIEIAEVESDKLLVTFKNLPEDLNDIALEIYDFCPDTIDQGFGCTDDMDHYAPRISAGDSIRIAENDRRN